MYSLLLFLFATPCSPGAAPPVSRQQGEAWAAWRRPHIHIHPPRSTARSTRSGAALAANAAREAAPDGALAAARGALETLDAGASTRAAAAAISDPVRADLARSAAAGERAALVDLVGALAEARA